MGKEIFTVEGMSCASCSAAIERSVKKVKGVSKAEVNLTTKRLDVEWNETSTTPSDIISAVEKSGYTAFQKTEEKPLKLTHNYTNDKKIERTELIISWIFSLLIMYIAMGHMLPFPLPLPSFISSSHNPVNFALIQLLLTIPVLYTGRLFFIRGFKALAHFNPTMDSLIAMGSSASFLYSLFLTFLISTDTHLVHNLYYESAAVVLTFVMTGKYIEKSSTNKTNSAISSLLQLSPQKAFILPSYDNPENKLPNREINTEDVREGNVLLIKPGSTIPLDGIVLEGDSEVDESMLTGENMSVDKTQGNTVIGGTLNGSGVLIMRVTKTGKNTSLAKIISFIEEAQNKKAPIARFADIVSGIFVPVVLGLAVLSAGIWILNGAESHFVIRIVTSVLVIACPCALGLATPAAIMVGTGIGASKGILIRSADILEILQKTTTVVLDKTGTVTKGKPVVTDIIVSAKSPYTKKEILNLSYLLEKNSTHPLSFAVIKEAQKEKLEDSGFSIGEEKNIPGQGITGIVHDTNNNNYFCVAGNKKLMISLNIETDSLQKNAEHLEENGKTIIYISREKELLGLIALEDEIKETSIGAVKDLKKMGLEVILLSGDNRRSAQSIGKKIDADKVISEVLPQDKARVIEELQKQGKIVLMAGDGINDSPALVQADIGAAMGKGSDTAIESGDIVLMHSSIDSITDAILLSKATLRVIKQNLFWAFLYNIIGIPAAAGVLYPSFGILLNPMIAGFAMALSSISVVSNALRLRPVYNSILKNKHKGT